MEAKVCVKCKRLLPIEDYHKDSNLKTGRRGRCKECCMEDLRKRIEKDPDGYRIKRLNASRKRKENDPEAVKAKYLRNREKSILRKREWYQENREIVLAQKRLWHKQRQRNYVHDAIKSAARWQINFALSKGLTRKPEACSLCGQNNALDAHHPDYSKPLDVIWLCRSCHMRIHRTTISPMSPGPHLRP